MSPGVEAPGVAKDPEGGDDEVEEDALLGESQSQPQATAVWSKARSLVALIGG